LCENLYKNGKKDGEQSHWHSNQLSSKYFYKDGEKVEKI